MSEVVPWFSRRRTPGDLETKVLNSSGSRCKFLDENGEDIRFKEPGFRWGMFKEMRKEVYKDYAERIQAVFDEVYEKITRIKRENETSQSPIPVLPTIKTPAISKTRSRVAAAGVKPPTQHLSPKRDTPVISQPSFNTPSPSTTKSTKVPETVENPPEVIILDVTNTTVRRSMRLNKKDVPTKPSDNRSRAPHQQQTDIELKPADVQPSESTSARPKRNTRSRATKATASSSNAGPDTKAEPVRRSTRATSRRAAAKAAQKRIEDSFVEISEEPGDAHTTKANVEEGESELAEGERSGKNEKPKRESVSLQQVKMSVCKVSLEKVASPVTTPTVIEAPPPPPPSEGTSEKEEESTANSKDEQPDSMEASSSSHEVITIDGEEEEEGSDVAAVAPPPKRSLSVKPKRKVKGRGGKKGGARKGRKGATAAARRVTPIPILEEKEDEGTVEPMEEDNNGGASGAATRSSTSSPPSQQQQQGPLSTSSSSETVYESCVSQQSPVRVSPLNSTGSDAMPRNSPSVTCEDHDNESLDTHGTESKESATVVKKPTSRIPVLRLVKSPLPSQRFSSGSLKSPAPASPLLSSPCPATSSMTSSLETEAPPLATTHVKKSRHEKKENIGTSATSINKSKKQLIDSPRTKEMPSSLINRDSPAGPMNATYRVPPVSVPYLSKGHTPKTIRQLQEKLRSQTKGKLISLEELRNASPLFKKLSAKRKAAAAPSTVVKDGSSVVLSPSKIPRLSPSSPLGSGIKRLRSVSLERLSSDHMTNPKRKSGSGSSSGEAVIIGDDDGSPVLPTTPAANSANTRSSMSDFDDDSSTPLPPSSSEKEEEGAESSQEEDIMNVSTASSLGEELSYTPTPHPQEGACPYDSAKTGSSNKLGGNGNSIRTDFLKAMFSKKHNFTKEDIAKKAPAVTSLIPAKNSPRKIETRVTRQEKLAEKVQRKREEEERRREELKAKKLQEIEEKKKKREAKAKKVAENQAALKEQEQEKKNRLKGQAKDDPVQKLNQKRAREVREKQRKHREKAQAAETKRREEEEAAKKRAQQIEEEWRIVTELASKRKEIEEEEKRQKRLDKQKEREQKKKQRELEEEKKQQAAAVTTATETAAASRKPPTATRASGNAMLKKMVVDDPKKRMEELLTGAITKVRAPTPVGKGRGGGGSGCGSSGEEACPGSGGKSNGFLKQFYGVVNDSGAKSTSSTAKTKSKKTPVTATTATTSSAMSGSKLKPIQENNCIVIDDTSQSESDDDEYSTPLKDITSALNSTFTKEESSIENSTAAKEKGEHTTAKGVENHPNSNFTTTTVGTSSCTPTHNNHFHLMAGSALASTLAAKSHEANGPQSYAMTPADRDPLLVYENYDIANLSSEDSTDDEECPRKVIPQWAGSHALNSFMLDQEAALEANCIDIAKIFPPEQLLKDIDLARIFKFKRKRFFQRSSSAHWNSPLYKKNRFEI